jgi:hypothetical protein
VVLKVSNADLASKIIDAKGGLSSGQNENPAHQGFD